MVSRVEQNIYVDKDGKEYVLDEVGNKIPPMQSRVIAEASGWSVYDSSQGHCPLCGKLTCSGYCVK